MRNQSRILSVQVRPFRVAVLVANNASPGDLLLALRFFSYLWGGRYCLLLSVNPTGDDPFAFFHLSQYRPDLVYSIGIDRAVWSDRVKRACQPRGYGPLESNYVDNLHDSIEEHVTVGHVIHYARRQPAIGGRQSLPLRIFDCDPKSELRPFVAAMFGINYENIAKAIPVEQICLPAAAGASELICAYNDYLSKPGQTWLDFGGEGLTYSYTPVCSPPPPTIVIVNSLVSDLALFWNLRQGSTLFVPSWVLPLPESAICDASIVAPLTEWFQLWEKRVNCNTCQIISTSVPQSALSDFANRLQKEVTGTMITRFHVSKPTNRFPLVIHHESERQVTVNLSRRVLSFHPPRPKILEGISRCSWIVELTKDVRRGRSINDLCLPPCASAFEVLNAPGPTSIPMTRFPRFGDGVDGINIHCSGRSEFVRVFLPTGEEILGEVLREALIKPVSDEKRACYQPVLRMFGGLDKAAQAFVGQRGAVLKALLEGPLELSEIQGLARLGKGKLAELAEPEIPRGMLDHLGPIAKRLFRRRRRRMWNKFSPATTAVESLLEFWSDKGVLAREWRVGPCPACMASFWERALNISKPVNCPGCGSRLRLPSQVPIGYSLHRLVGHAIRQGMIPVVLAGRFLSNLTHKGFLWLPGTKLIWGENAGDLDVLACCDGHLIVGECKSLSDTSPRSKTWDDLLKQFAETLKVGRACRASFAFLAVMAEKYPLEFVKEVEQLTVPTMQVLMLNREDLERGHRVTSHKDEKIERRLSLSDLIVDPMPEAQSDTSDGS